MASNEQIFDIVGILIQDVNTSLEYMVDETKSEFWRRAHVRSVFALIEGWIFSMKDLVLKSVAAEAAALPAGDIALLQENAFELDKAGDLQVLPKFIPVEKNIKFVFRCLAVALRSDFQIDTSSLGWSAFKAALSMRNRITHPRSPVDLTLTTDEMNTVQDAMEWFRSVSSEVFRGKGTTAA